MPYIPTAVVNSGGGLSSVWTNSFTEAGTALSNWQQDSGSWSVASSAFHVDATGGIARLKYNTSQDSKMMVMYCYSADIMLESALANTNAPGGLLTYWDGAGSGDVATELFEVNSSTFQV